VTAQTPTDEQIREADNALGIQPLMGGFLMMTPIRPLWQHLTIAYLGRVWERKGYASWLDYIRKETLVSPSWAGRVARRVDEGRYRLAVRSEPAWEGWSHG